LPNLKSEISLKLTQVLEQLDYLKPTDDPQQLLLGICDKLAYEVGFEVNNCTNTKFSFFRDMVLIFHRLAKAIAGTQPMFQSPVPEGKANGVEQISMPLDLPRITGNGTGNAAGANTNRAAKETSEGNIPSKL
jgi:hypothetical protein